MTVPGIIDAHMHYFDVEGFRETALAAGHENSAACWRKICRENGIVFAVAMGNTMDEPSFYGGVPPRLIDLAGPFDREHYNQPDDIGYCLGVMSEEIGEGQAEATAREFEPYLREPHCLGIKLYPGYNKVYANDRRHWPLFELARAYDVPVAIHCGDTARPQGLLKYSHPLNVDEAAVTFPDVTFVICHVGNPWILDACEVAAKDPNVALDLSGLLAGNVKPLLIYDDNRGYIRYLRTWLNYLGDYGRVMYGSDWPLVNIPAYIRFIAHTVPEEYHEDVFYRSALRIYKRIGPLLKAQNEGSPLPSYARK